MAPKNAAKKSAAKKVVEVEVKVATPEPEPEIVKVATPVEEEPVAEVANGKKPLNEYQQFINATVAKLKADPEVMKEFEDIKNPYMKLRSLANKEWLILHPKEVNDKPKRQYKPRAKKVVDEDEEKEKPKKRKSKKDADGEEKPKRAPTAYNLFVQGIMVELKAKYADMSKEEKPTQRELMKEAAERWREFKAQQEEVA